jgi:hypothetical protein
MLKRLVEQIVSGYHKIVIRRLIDQVRKLADTDEVHDNTRNGEHPVHCVAKIGIWAVEYTDAAIDLYCEGRHIAQFDELYARRKQVVTLTAQSSLDVTGQRLFAEVLGGLPLIKGEGY